MVQNITLKIRFILYKFHISSKKLGKKKMVAYARKHFSLALLLGLHLLVISSHAKFSMMVTKSEIDSICKEGVNSSLCFEILKSTPEIATLDFSGLTKFLIDYQTRNVSDTLKQVKLFAENTTDFRSHNIYSSCLDLYESYFSYRGDTLKALATKDYDTLNVMVSGTITGMSDCNDELLTINPIPQLLITKGIIIKNQSSIILVILECFLRKDKTRCH